jgi:class 3 adenylate cyclase
VWWLAVRNFLMGTLISVVPAVAFYSAAFEYTPEQLRLLSVLGTSGAVFFLLLDLGILALVLRPVRAALLPCASPGAIQQGIARLRALPVLVLPRIFGPHALVATAVLTLLVVWANRRFGLGIDEATFPIYWLVNLSVVPVGHVVFEYHATERLIRKPLAYLLPSVPREAAPEPARGLGLAPRIFLFSGLLGLAPPVIVGLVLLQRAQGVGLELSSQFLLQLSGAGVALAMLWVLLLALVSRELGEQTRAITSALDRIAGGELATTVPVYSVSEFGKIGAAVNRMAAGLRERQQLRDLFGAYMTRDLAEQLLGASELTATERRKVTVMIVDLREFTALSTKYPAETVVQLLNEFFAPTVAAIAREHGHVNKFLGDGLLAVFGAPGARADAADCAVRAAIEIRHGLDALNSDLAARGWPQLKMGAAIHTGEAIVGTIGVPEHKLEYTVVGEAVNLTSRVEALNKSLGTDILLTRETVQDLRGSYNLRALPPAEVRGIPRPVEVFALEE